MADEEVKVPQSEEKDELLITKKETICQICCKQISKYTCPRCNAPYCSLACYKSAKHLHCSESFYKNCIMENVEGQSKNSEEKKKMLDILRRLESNSELEVQQAETDAGSLEERLASVDLQGDPDMVWAVLNESERKEFESSLASGALARMLEAWKPWWVHETEEHHRLLVEEIKTQEEPSRKKANSQLSALPQVLKNIPTLTSLTKVKPNINVKFTIISVLYGYAYVMRLYNGCLDVPEQISENLLRLSPVLLQNEIYDSEESVIISCLDTTRQNKDLFNGEAFSNNILQDVIDISDGPKKFDLHAASYVCIALSEIYRLLEKGRKALRHITRNNKKEQKLCKDLWCAKKKLYFLLAWSNENSTVIKEMVPSLKALQTSVSLQYEKHLEAKQNLEDIWGGPRPAEQKPLIIEL